jgi:hypothetical protein
MGADITYAADYSGRLRLDPGLVLKDTNANRAD